MTAKELADYIRIKTRTNITTFSDAVMLSLVQLRQDELSRELMNGLAEDEDTFLTPQTTDLVANTSHRDYGFPPNILSRIKRVEAKLDSENWVRLKGFDLSNYEGTHDEETILENFSNKKGECYYDITRKSLFIYSGEITANEDGLKLWCFNYPTKITDLTEDTRDLDEDPSTTEHGFPRELHELLARGVVIDWKESRENPIPLNEREQNYYSDVKKAISTLKHGDLNRSIVAKVPYNDGSQY